MSQPATEFATAEAPLQLTPPEPVQPVAPAQAASAVKLEPAVIDDLNAKVEAFVQQVVELDSHSEGFQAQVNRIHQMGNAEIRAAASVSNRLLQRPMHALETLDRASPVGRSLIDLRQKVEDLDPSRQGNLLAPKKLFGIIPMGNRLRDYFDRYRSAQAHLKAIIQSLLNGQDELMKDNAAIEQEKLNAWGLMQKLEQYVYLGKQLDGALDQRLSQIEAADPHKARVVREELQFYVRQKVQDLLTQLAVTMQGYLAMDMLRKNNLELIKGVDRATSTTISALRTAVLVAQALANQKLVLDQITALNTTTSNLIESTSAQLKMQGAAIQEQAMSASIGIETLKRSFQNIYDAMDAMDSYKLRALDNMKQTVDALSQEVEKAHTYLDRTRSDEARTAVEAAPAGPGVSL